MSKLKIKNFGPIKEGFKDSDGSEWMDIKKVTVFIGNQGSGKSTVAKVISTLVWIEKALNRGDFSTSWSFAQFYEQFEYQNMHNYFRDDTIIEYTGERYNITYDRNKNQWPIIRESSEDKYLVPKIMYVPAERNFLSVIKDAYSVRGLPEPLFEFAEELKKYQNDIGPVSVKLPVNNVYYKYDRNSETGVIFNDDYSVDMLAASSGFQSLVPLFLVTFNLANIIAKTVELNPENINVNQKIRMNSEIGEIMINTSLTETEKLQKVDLVKAKFLNKAFINIVEEPELNLFPSSQRQILNSLLAFNNMKPGNKLIMTTHSPYLINYLTLAVKAEAVLKILSPASMGDADLNYLNEIVPIGSVLAPDGLVIYELDETDGTIKKVENYKGLPSDENYLNESLAESNELYAQLLEIQQNYEH
jgi:predicted ATPase